jgi:hypothetical protein
MNVAEQYYADVKALKAKYAEEYEYYKEQHVKQQMVIANFLNAYDMGLIDAKDVNAAHDFGNVLQRLADNAYKQANKQEQADGGEFAKLVFDNVD